MADFNAIIIQSDNNGFTVRRPDGSNERIPASHPNYQFLLHALPKEGMTQQAVQQQAAPQQQETRSGGSDPQAQRYKKLNSMEESIRSKIQYPSTLTSYQPGSGVIPIQRLGLEADPGQKTQGYIHQDDLSPEEMEFIISKHAALASKE